MKEQILVCPYCGEELENELQVCCGEMHGEWQDVDDKADEKTLKTPKTPGQILGGLIGP